MSAGTNQLWPSNVRGSFFSTWIIVFRHTAINVRITTPLLLMGNLDPQHDPGSPAILPGCLHYGPIAWTSASLFLDSYIEALSAMMNAFLDFVDVVNRQFQKRGDYRFVSVSVTAYVGRAAGVLSYVAFCPPETARRRWNPGRAVPYRSKGT